MSRSIVVRQRSDSVTVGWSLLEGETARYGCWQFMNLRRLAEREQLVLWSEELPIMLLRLAE